jgi:hypothetical protein
VAATALRRARPAHRPFLAAATVVTVLMLASGTALTPATAQAAPADPADQTAQPAPAEDGAEWEIRPVYWEDTSLPGGHFNYALTAGTSIDDGIEILNLGPQRLRFDVYGADLLTAAGGGLAPASRGSPSRSAGDWIVPAFATVEVAPHGSVEVPFTVSIPVGTRTGNHRGALVVERRTSPAQETAPTIDPRLAQRVLIAVRDEVDLGAEIGELVGVRERGRIRFELPVRNTSNVTVTSSGVVTVESRGRQVELELSPAGLPAVPGGVAVLSATWDDPPWVGRASAAAAVDVVVGDDAPVRFASSRITLWLFPRTLLLIVGGLLLVTLGLAVREGPRRRLRRWSAERREDRAVLRRHRAQRRSRVAVPTHGGRGTRAERHRRRRHLGARR